jgi:UvrD-like helicase C-terminal domain
LFYADDLEQQEQLARWRKEFKSQGYRPADITVLSFRTSDDCAAARLAATGFKLRPAWQHALDASAYTSVQAFKGMENKVIILTDVVLGESHFHRHLFYTGMTRANESVRVSCDNGSQQTLAGWLAEKA